MRCLGNKPISLSSKHTYSNLPDFWFQYLYRRRLKITSAKKEVNYSQTNDLEKLIRSKRENIQKLEKQKIVIRTNGEVISSGIVFNNKLYFGSNDGKVYEYDPVTQQKVVITTNGVVLSSGIVFNNKLYFGSDDRKVYEYDPVTNQQKVVITTNG
ncbi:PQQ-binding-like beta-propeller repeat protein [Spiroplasma endosymbiont of Nephrotoma flavescens]|uniref:PQQ-binding-like beta-propeller repeat protein n=1 Tax=Spiroplasma endosymbiont of Nephrotoma flavescens TaxID=3066302 RepID=UPI00313A9042